MLQTKGNGCIGKKVESGNKKDSYKARSEKIRLELFNMEYMRPRFLKMFNSWVGYTSNFYDLDNLIHVRATCVEVFE